MSVTQTGMSLAESTVERAHLRLRDLCRVSTAFLERLPEGLEFPDGMRDRVSYDPVRKRLVFRGYMSSADHYFLRECNDAPDYLRAVDELHRDSEFEIVHHSTVVPKWLWALVTACFGGAAVFWVWWWLFVS